MIDFISAKRHYIMAIAIMFVVVSLSGTTYSLFFKADSTGDFNYNTGNLLTPWAYVKARACPVCGKLELYVDPIKAKLNEVIYD